MARKGFDMLEKLKVCHCNENGNNERENVRSWKCGQGLEEGKHCWS